LTGYLASTTVPAVSVSSVGAAIQRFVAALVGRPAFWAIFLAVGFAFPIVRSMTRKLPPAPPHLGEVAPFTLVDHAGEKVTLESLRGKVWVADFISMQETKTSDDMSKTLSRVRYRARNLSHAFHLVTITIDPTRDDLAQRAKYAARFSASTATWQFLGGGEEDVKAALRSFQVTIDASPDVAEFARRERIVLVDQRGKIRGYYQTDLSSIDGLVADIGLVANDPNP
jgi:protein SCO1/2